MKPQNVSTVLLCLLLGACAAPVVAGPRFVGTLEEGESLKLDVRTGGCLTSARHYRLRFRGPAPFGVEAWKIETCKHGAERVHLVASGELHPRIANRFDASLHAARHQFPLMRFTSWKALQLEWQNGSDLLQRENLVDYGTVSVGCLGDDWMLSELGLIEELRRRAAAE